MRCFLGDLVLYAVESEAGSEAINGVVRTLADDGQRAVVVVDRCAPETHRIEDVTRPSEAEGAPMGQGDAAQTRRHDRERARRGGITGRYPVRSASADVRGYGDGPRGASRGAPPTKGRNRRRDRARAHRRPPSPDDTALKDHFQQFMQILKAFVDAEWLAELDARLAAYRAELDGREEADRAQE